MDQGTYRLLVFAAIFGAMAVYELLLPRRRLIVDKGRRWFTNLAILIIDAALVRLLFPLAAVGFAIHAQDNGWGLLNLLQVNGLAAGFLAFVILDVAIYAQHVASHKIPLFWRLHRVHHADRDIDVTTALRFHPIEILLSMGWKAAIIYVVGAPPLAVFIFEAVLNGAAVFNHANVRLPLMLDRWLRLIIVTPDMHRVHHSVIPAETDSNYGFNFSIWDRLFGTYIAQPRDGHEGMDIGLKQYRDENPSKISWCLQLPFSDKSKPDQ